MLERFGFLLLDSEDLVFVRWRYGLPAASTSIFKGQRDWNPISIIIFEYYAWLYKHGS
jgi:hypothetical protein